MLRPTPAGPELLLAQRPPGEALAGFWEFPGGKLEAGETALHAVVREVREELGVDGEVVSLIGVYAFELRNEVIAAYHVKATGEIQLSSELSEMKRVPPEKLRPWPMGTGHAVRDWLARRGAGPGETR